MQASIPYGIYWSTPFAKWQGSLAEQNALTLAAKVADKALAEREVDRKGIDLGILGITNPQKGGFYGLPYVTGLLGLERVAGPTVQQACATSVRAMQMAAQEIECASSGCTLLVMADRQSNGPLIHYPNPKGPGGYGETERWVLDNMAQDPYARNSMLQTGENAARRYGISTAEQHAVKLRRFVQYQDALDNDRAFQRRFMVSAPIAGGRGRKDGASLDADEGVFVTTAEGLATLKPVQDGGSVTFGGQTHPADGNAGMLITTADRAREMSRNKSISIEILAFGMARVEPGYMPVAPAPAAQLALRRAGVKAADLDAVKTHNPFAVNDIVLARETGFPWERMNNYGSSIVWGHPQAPTGLRGVIELIEELSMRGGGLGLFTGCAAGDTGHAVVIKVSDARKG
ncbi:acetyl-CoA acetyltransferase [Acidovorax sp. Leaf84]|uniref:thiolase family protein n=1 Tax=Acidovorax sp. Leaf84 TaxID=1736240 RepID=UPI0006FB7BC0|nr:thiolase family protein [Acidovorax sp. Leaf84]KQO40161.1 acetyl-CoA acetyltransferase [Acidovorax sp. Leaf84]